MPDDATVEILLKWKQENEQVVAAVQAQLAGLTAQATAATAATNAASAAAAGGVPAWLLWAAAIAGASAALFPFVAIAGSAIVILSAFAVAGAGTLALLGSLALGFGAIGAAVIALGISAMGGTDPGATLEKATKARDAAQQALANFDRINPGGFHGPTAQAGRNRYDAQQALADFDALTKGHQLTLAQQQQREDLLLRLTRAQDAYNNSSGGGLTVAQQIEREKLVTKLADATNAYNAALVNGTGPMNTFRENLEGMFEKWGKQAAPMTAVILLWADKAIPAVTQLGSAIMTWFGERLTGALNAISTVVKNLTPDFENFGRFLGGFFDRIGGLTSIGPGGTIVTLGGVFENFARLVISAVRGLLDVLGNLSQWFLERLPVYGPVVQQIMGWIGSVVLGVAQIWGRFADWLVQNWPAITETASKAAGNIRNEWDKWWPSLKPLMDNALPLMALLIQKIADNSGALTPIFAAALAVATLLAAAILGVAAAVMAVVTQAQNALSLLDKLRDRGPATPYNPPVPFSGGQSASQVAGAPTPTFNVTNNISGQSNPQETANQVTRQMRGLLLQ